MKRNNFFSAQKNLFRIVFLFSALFTINYLYAQNYVSNRAPLTETPFIALPLGSIKPEGWLKTQLLAQKEGLTGYSEIIYPELAPDSEWLGGTAPNSNWERPTYYVKGLIALAYTLNDTALMTKAQKWIDWTLNSQQPDGSFGPSSSNDWWARMPMITALMDYCDATGDDRVVPFLTNYFRYQLENLPERPLAEWAKARASDNVDVVIWLYNRTGDSFLLELANLIKEQAYDFSGIFTNNTFLTGFHTDFFPKHGVNVAQAYKYGAVFYQLTNNLSDKNTMRNGVENLYPYHTQITGMNTTTEFLSGMSSVQGVELCAIVERMFSNEISLRVLGDAKIADELEKVAFNHLPAALSENHCQHQYYVLPNQVQSKKGHNGFGQDYDNGVVPGPFSGYPCCRYNWHMGWPKFTQFSWMATPDSGLVAATYAPCMVNARVGDSIAVTITENTDYPFEEQIRLTVEIGSPTKFPLKLRIPEWCKNPEILVNGQPQPAVVPGSYFTIDKTWANNDVVVINLPMPIALSKWVNNSVGIERGPLVYSLKMDEDWKKINTYTFAEKDFSEYEVYPKNNWNYALVLGPENPAESFTVEKSELSGNPFSPETTPVKLKVKAKKLPGWGLTANGVHAAEPPYSPVISAETEEEITLIPFGSERIRLTYFPFIGPVKENDTIFVDNFVSKGPNYWTSFGGGWQQKDGKYYSESFNVKGAKSVAMGTHFSDFTYDVNITILNGETQGGVIFRCSDAAMGVDSYKGYYAALNTSGEVILGKANNSWSHIKSANLAINPSATYHLRVQAIGTEIKVFVDNMDVPVITANDNQFKTGYIGLRQYSGPNTPDPSGQTVLFENLEVRAWEEPVSQIIRKPLLESTIEFFPNPVNDVIYFNELATSPVDAANIYSASGKIIFSQKKAQNYIDVSKLPEGIYLIVLMHEGSKTVRQFLKI
ncbi:MAG: glycoside hydrolase family 127 protein [Bacteroidales bacterium]|nr:glycoside hydrolase family 127 protein [Bacteroidales bacterium]